MKKLICAAKEAKKRAHVFLSETLNSNRGDSHIVAVVLVVVIVIALAAVFREQMFGVIEELFDKTDVSSF